MEVKTWGLGDGCKANRWTEMFQYHIQYNRRVYTIKILNNKVLYPFSMHVVTFTFHYQLMHILIKTLSQFIFKTPYVKNVCNAYLKLI